MGTWLIQELRFEPCYALFQALVSFGFGTAISDI
jgi:hypothetical protein